MAGDLTLSPAAYRQLDRLRLRASKYLRGGNIGQRGSARRRPAADFREHRQYVPGDDVRFVDWKASARSEAIYLKQGELLQETTIHLLIDTSASMGWGSPPKGDGVLLLAAALGFLALANDDRLQVVPIGASAAPLQIKGKGQFPRLIKYLRGLTFAGKADVPAGIRQFAAQNGGGVVVLLSDLLDTRNLGAALAGLPRPTWDVTVLQTLHSEELAPRLNGEFEMVDAESGRHINYDITPKALAAYKEHFETWRSGLEMTCIEHNAFYTVVNTTASLSEETLPHLRRVNVLEVV